MQDPFGSEDGAAVKYKTMTYLVVSLSAYILNSLYMKAKSNIGMEPSLLNKAT